MTDPLFEYKRCITCGNYDDIPVDEDECDKCYWEIEAGIVLDDTRIQEKPISSRKINLEIKDDTDGNTNSHRYN